MREVRIMKLVQTEANRCSEAACELRFRSLFNQGRGYAFPCDPSGKVDMDRMSERTRNAYLYARAIVGLELAAPCVVHPVAVPVERRRDPAPGRADWPRDADRRRCSA
jgi:hypothetical protein